MSVLSSTHLHDEAAAFAYVERKLWPKGPVCPKCGSVNHATALKGVRRKPSQKCPEGLLRHGLYQCKGCRKQFNVRIGTIFESSNIPLHKWLQACVLLTASKKGISSNQLSRALGITLKSAWFMSHRIREAMRDDEVVKFGARGGIVEVDETFIGVDPDQRKRRGGYAHKNKVLTLIDRETGRSKSVVVDDLKAETLLPILRENIAAEARVFTDEAGQYRNLGDHFAEHQTVHHTRGEYVRGEVHTNTAEFDFRYRNRIATGIDDGQRAEIALLGAKGKRLRYA